MKMTAFNNRKRSKTNRNETLIYLIIRNSNQEMFFFFSQLQFSTSMKRIHLAQGLQILHPGGIVVFTTKDMLRKLLHQFGSNQTPRASNYTLFLSLHSEKGYDNLLRYKLSRISW